MRAFLDTNVLVAALISRGACKELFEYCLSSHTVCVSVAVLVEFQAALEMLKFPQASIDQAIGLIKANSVIVDPEPLPESICRDKDDDAVLSGAVRARADCLVTGDDDLLVLAEYQGVPILKPAEFWRLEKDRY